MGGLEVGGMRHEALRDECGGTREPSQPTGQAIFTTEMVDVLA